MWAFLEEANPAFFATYNAQFLADLVSFPWGGLACRYAYAWLVSVVGLSYGYDTSIYGTGDVKALYCIILYLIGDLYWHPVLLLTQSL